jgi:putative transposase
MTRPYSEDLRERAVARFEAGETTRAIAAALRISPSCVSKWMKLKRATGSLAPGKVGGHKKRTLSGEPAAWLRERCRSGPFTTRGLRRNSRPAASRPTGGRSGCSCTPRG